MVENSSHEPVPDSAELQVSGGVNLAANDVGIGGDVAGRDQTTHNSTEVINTGGGAYVGGNVQVKGRGKFIGRDDNSKVLYIFRSVRQVIAFLFIILAVVAAVAAGYWRLTQPAYMTGDFNIAVAEFEEISPSDQATLAPIMSSGLFNYLDSAYKANAWGGRVQVAHDKIGLVHSADEAARVAQRVNATLVIYGTVSVLGNEAKLTPKFWINNAAQNDTNEMIGAGEHHMEFPLLFSVQQVLNDQSSVNTVLHERADILIKFTQALVYRKTVEYAKARTVIQQAIADAEDYGKFNGKETLYLIAADIARLNKDLPTSQQYVSVTLAINPNYARGYIAQGNILYEQRDFRSAYQYYTQALSLTDQPYGAHILEKANLGLGNIFSFQFQSQPAQAAFAQLALEHFNQVIEAYQQSKDPAAAELAALAYYGQGLIYQIQHKTDQAKWSFEQALQLSTDPVLRLSAQTRLNQLSSN